MEFLDNTPRNSHQTFTQRCDSGCKDRYNDCKAMIDSLTKELWYVDNEKLKMGQR
jgi:hypothetical protein